MSELINLSTAATILSAPLARARRLLKTLPVIDYGKGRSCGKRWSRSDVEALARSLLKTKDSKLQASLGMRQQCAIADLSGADIYRMIHSQDTAELTRTRTLQ